MSSAIATPRCRSKSMIGVKVCAQRHEDAESGDGFE
jgi:hypothetical protein